MFLLVLLLFLLLILLLLILWSPCTESIIYLPLLYFLLTDLCFLSQSFRFKLKQEEENSRNTAMMHNTCKDQLRRSEEQQQLEVQERQKAELTCRNLELDIRTLANNIKQVAPRY